MWANLRVLEDAVAAHPASINVTLVEDISVDGSPGFTVWPAQSNGTNYATDKNVDRVFPEHNRR